MPSMLATYRWKTQCLALCSESNICDLMTNYVRGWRRKKMMFNSASSRSRRLPALKRGKVLLKTEAKHYWLIDSDEARSRSIHHNQRNLTHYLGSTPGDATHGPSNQHWHWFTGSQTLIHNGVLPLLFTAHCAEYALYHRTICIHWIFIIQP